MTVPPKSGLMQFYSTRGGAVLQPTMVMLKVAALAAFVVIGLSMTGEAPVSGDP